MEAESPEIPEDATVVRQSSWVWMIWVVPLAVLAIASVSIDVVTFGILPWIVAAGIVVMRFLSWRSTSFVLTNDYIVIRRGAARHQRFDVPISQISDLRIRHGPFGRTLGYAGVDLILRNGQVAILHYVPEDSSLVEHLRSRIDRTSQSQEETEG